MKSGKKEMTHPNLITINNSIQKVISFIVEDLEMGNEGLYDIQLCGSYVNGFVDDKSDIDIVFIVEDVDKWRQKISSRLKRKIKSEDNVDILMVSKNRYLKVKHLLRNYSLTKNKFLYNEEHEYMPTIFPGPRIRSSTADYTLKIKRSKIKRLKQAYKDDKIFFPTKQLEQEWLELLDKTTK